MTFLRTRMSNNFEDVFKLFKKHYKLIPLERFGNNSYRILVSTILSSRTKDEITYLASRKLFEKAPNIKILNELDIKKIKKLIYPVGFYNTKAKHLKNLAEIIEKEYKGKIPTTRDELLNLPGVGRKTANLVLNRAFGKQAISVDTHVHTISNLLGWVNTKTPEETEKELIKILPKKYWKEINMLFVSIGRQFRSKKSLVKFLRKNNLI
ncbi:MAG TPA: endonuclease III [Patescibacteria group bacterium]|nr:endonuclease III [Patescibacteria group bacterium]